MINSSTRVQAYLYLSKNLEETHRCKDSSDSLF